MKDSIEKELSQWKSSYDENSPDFNQIDQAIEEGYLRAKSRKSKFQPMLLTGITTAAVLLFGFIIIANLMVDQTQSSDNPNTNIKNSIQSAKEYGYYEEVDKSQTKGDYELTINDVIRDQYGIIVFYTLKGQTSARLDTSETQITSKNILLPGGTSSHSGENISNGDGMQEFKGVYHYYSDQPIKTNEFIFKAGVMGQEDIQFSIPFNANNQAPPKTYAIDQEVTISEQSIMIKNITVNPTRASVKLKISPENSMEIYSIDDIRLVNSNGEAWKGISSGISATGPDEAGNITYYLESPYFENNQELYLEFSKVQAVPKDQTYLKLDLDQEKILFDPYNKFFDLDYNNGSISLKMYQEDNFHHAPFGEILTAAGEEIELNTGYHSGFSEYIEEDGKEVVKFGKSVGKISGIVKVELTAYPHWIEKDIRIQVK